MACRHIDAAVVPQITQVGAQVHGVHMDFVLEPKSRQEHAVASVLTPGHATALGHTAELVSTNNTTEVASLHEKWHLIFAYH